jgi:hypothetical protein
MTPTLEQVRQGLDSGRLTKASLMRKSGLDWKTVDNAVSEKRKTHSSTIRVLLDAASDLLNSDIPIQSNITPLEPEALADLESAPRNMAQAIREDRAAKAVR